jgi:predicted metal-binding membrane protein
MAARLTRIEAALRHDRAALAIILVAIPLVAWAWVVAMALDMYGTMRGASRWMMTPEWDAPHLLLLWAMWAVMMAAMMLPSATPVLLMYGRSARARAHDRQDGESAAAARPPPRWC